MRYVYWFSFFYFASQSFLFSQTNDSIKIFKNKKFEIAVSLGNNGQVADVINSFYNDGISKYAWYSQRNFNSVTTKSTELKYNLTASYFFKSPLLLKIKFGFQDYKSEYKYDYEYEKLEGYCFQNSYNLNPAIGYKLRNQRLEIIAGIEIPFYFIDDFKYHEKFFDYRDWNNVPTLTSIYDQNYKLDGGIIYGINMFGNLKYIFFKNLFVYSELSAGLLYANIGKEYISEINTTQYQIPSGTTYYSYQKIVTDYKLKKTYFSSFEINCGIGIKF